MDSGQCLTKAGLLYSNRLFFDFAEFSGTDFFSDHVLNLLPDIFSQNLILFLVLYLVNQVLYPVNIVNCI